MNRSACATCLSGTSCTPYEAERRKMGDWYDTVWGITLLGFLGSVLAALFLKITVIVLNRIGPRLFLHLYSNILIQYAENKYFTQKCEANNRPELIAVNYSMTMSRLTGTRIMFIITIVICFIMWTVYVVSPKGIILISSILFSLFAIKDFYNFVVLYLAVIGCFPGDMKKYHEEIKSMKKEDRYRFIAGAVMGETKGETP